MTLLFVFIEFVLPTRQDNIGPATGTPGIVIGADDIGTAKKKAEFQIVIDRQGNGRAGVRPFETAHIGKDRPFLAIVQLHNFIIIIDQNIFPVSGASEKRTGGLALIFAFGVEEPNFLRPVGPFSCFYINSMRMGPETKMLIAAVDDSVPFIR